MNTPTRGRAALTLAALLVLAGSLRAGNPVSENLAETKKANGSAPSFLTRFSSNDGTDSTTWSPTAALSGRTVVTFGDPLLEVVVRHSAAGATACVEVGRRAIDGSFQGIAGIQTSTAGSGATVAYDGTGYYAPEPLYFAANGYYALELRVTDASGTSTVDLKPCMVGFTGRAPTE